MNRWPAHSAAVKSGFSSLTAANRPSRMVARANETAVPRHCATTVPSMMQPCQVESVRSLSITAALRNEHSWKAAPASGVWVRFVSRNSLRLTTAPANDPMATEQVSKLLSCRVAPASDTSAKFVR